MARAMRLKELDFVVGGDADGFTHIYLRDDGRKLVAFDVLDVEGKVMRPLGKALSGDERKGWLASFEMLCVEDWESEYIDPEVQDGTQWHLECRWNNRLVIRSVGSNAFPESWDGFIVMLSVFDDDLMRYVQEELGDYNYVSVVFKGSDKPYYYLATDEQEAELDMGDFCIVPTGPENAETVAMVVDIDYYGEEDAPYPPEKTKHVIRLVERPEDAALYGVVLPNEAEDDEEDEEDEDYGPDDPAAAAKELAHDLMEITQLLKAEDYEAAFEWALAHQYDRRHGIAAKVVTAYEAYMEAGLDEDGEAALSLGALYYAGLIVPRDYGKAVGYYMRAAQAGSVRAMGNLGYCYYYGRAVERDYQAAYHFFNQGVLLGNDANCLYKLGDMYMNGFFVKKDELMAFRLYTRAKGVCMESGEDGGEFWPDVALRLGRCFLEGTGTEQNLELAHTLLSIAVNGFYRRRHTDPFALSLIEKGEQLRDEAARKLKKEIEAVAEQ